MSCVKKLRVECLYDQYFTIFDIIIMPFLLFFVLIIKDIYYKLKKIYIFLN